MLALDAGAAVWTAAGLAQVGPTTPCAAAMTPARPDGADTRSGRLQRRWRRLSAATSMATTGDHTTDDRTTRTGDHTNDGHTADDRTDDDHTNDGQ